MNRERIEEARAVAQDPSRPGRERAVARARWRVLREAEHRHASAKGSPMGKGTGKCEDCKHPIALHDADGKCKTCASKKVPNKLQESALGRGQSARKEAKRLPDGSFAPKGLGVVLRPGASKDPKDLARQAGEFDAAAKKAFDTPGEHELPGGIKVKRYDGYEPRVEIHAPDFEKPLDMHLNGIGTRGGMTPGAIAEISAKSTHPDSIGGAKSFKYRDPKSFGDYEMGSNAETQFAGHIARERQARMPEVHKLIGGDVGKKLADRGVMDADERDDALAALKPSGDDELDDIARDFLETTYANGGKKNKKSGRVRDPHAVKK